MRTPMMSRIRRIGTRPRTGDGERGISLAESLVAAMVIALAILFTLKVVRMASGLGEEEQELKGMLYMSKVIYAEKRARELDVHLMVFMEQRGLLPGDFSGNKSGHVGDAPGEKELFFQDLKEIGAINTLDPLFLTQPFYFQWFDAPFLGDGRSGHYFVVPGFPIHVAKGLDLKLDNGVRTSGKVLFTESNAKHEVDLYIRYTG